MANFDPALITPTLSQAPSVLSGNGTAATGGASVRPHHGLIGIVLLAVLVLVVLDRIGFRFAVTAGRH